MLKLYWKGWMGGVSGGSELNPYISQHYLVDDVKKYRGGEKFEELLGGKIYKSW